MCLQIYDSKYDKNSQRRNKKRLYNFIYVCIERSEYKMKLNDWDIILMNHQMSLDREQAGKGYKTKLTSIAMEDTKGKKWYFYNSEEKKYYSVPFGNTALFVLNTLKTSDFNNPHYEKLVNKEIESGLDKEFIERTFSDLQGTRNKLDFLYTFLGHLNEIKKKYGEEEFLELVMRVWHSYRYCNLAGIWNDSYREEKDKFSDEYNKESLGYLHDYVTKRSCIYHDTMLFYGDGIPTVGRVFCLSGENSSINIFGWDLYHILMGNAPAPRVCKRCGQLYLSNNFKAKYCPDCKNTSNEIRNAKRKENPCRYLHKRITDDLNNYGDGSEEFRVESNYYWSVVKGKTPKQNPREFGIVPDSTIKTERQYLNWLRVYQANMKKSLK